MKKEDIREVSTLLGKMKSAVDSLERASRDKRYGEVDKIKLEIIKLKEAIEKKL